jgi:hypothetical protein
MLGSKPSCSDVFFEVIDITLNKRQVGPLHAVEIDYETGI